MIKLGRLIKTLRSVASLSQKTLAEELQISESYLCLLEVGKRAPSSDLIDRVAVFFSVSREALMFLSTSPPVELDLEMTEKYRKLQGNIASLLLFQGAEGFGTKKDTPNRNGIRTGARTRMPVTTS
jgi:transcriptional regulator with XRE-family HTH domain